MGKKEDNIKKAKNLINKLDYIRNIGIAEKQRFQITYLPVVV